MSGCSTDEMLDDLREIIHRAYRYDDKPHRLWSGMAALAAKYGDDASRDAMVKDFDRWYRSGDPFRRRRFKRSVHRLYRKMALTERTTNG